jgi:predicted nucleic acid-binding protein
VTLAYVDTSCLVAVALNEPSGRETTESLARFDRLVASNLLEAELRSTLARERVKADCAPLVSGISWVLPDRPLTTEFREVLGLGTVKGADLWHLACALFLRSRLAGISFLTLDRRQRELANALGFETGP